MKLQVIVHAMVYKTKRNEMTDRQTGQKMPWYQITLDQNDDVGTFTCSEDVYIDAPRGKECDLYGQYDEQSKRFKITGVVPNSADRNYDVSDDIPAMSDQPADAPAPADQPADAPAPADQPADAPAPADQPAGTDDSRHGKRK